MLFVVLCLGREREMNNTTMSCMSARTLMCVCVGVGQGYANRTAAMKPRTTASRRAMDAYSLVDDPALPWLSRALM